VLLVNTTLVKQIPTNQYLGLPFTEMSIDRLGLPQAMNTIVLGAVTFLLPFARRSLIRKSLEESLPAKIVDVNVKALNMGYREASKAFGQPPAIWAAMTVADNGNGDTEKAAPKKPRAKAKKA